MMNWTAHPSADYRGPRIALVHGLLAGQHMERHLLTFLRHAGFVDTTLYSNHRSPAVIASDMATAARAGRAVAMIGYSQGGFQVVKTARLLKRDGINVNLSVSVAAGGGGRLYPAQWGVNARRIPANVQRHLNYFSVVDRMGSDPVHAHNLAQAESKATHVENIVYPATAGVTHIETVRCFPAERILPPVQTLFLDRLITELSAL